MDETILKVAPSGVHLIKEVKMGPVPKEGLVT